MNPKDILFGTEARANILKGANILADAVKATLGPRGRNVMIDKGPHVRPRITKDGVSVAREIGLKNRFQDMGAQTLREVANKACDKAGDGTTTATVLAQAIFVEGNKAVAAGMNPIDIQRGVNLGVLKAIEHIKSRAKLVTSKEEWVQIATISANGDKEVGEKIAEALAAVGTEGIVSVEEGKGVGFELEIVEGTMFPCGYVSPYFVNRDDKPIVEFANPNILIIEGKLEKIEPIVPLLEMSIQQNKPLLIIADGIEGQALSILVMNRVRAGLQVCAVKAPSHGERRKEYLADLAILTGAQYINEDMGLRAENATSNVFGSATKIVVTKDDTTIVGGQGKKEEIEKRTNHIRAMYEEAETDEKKGPIKQRLAKFTGGVAVLKVGGATEVEVKERRDRVDDSLHATRAAIEEGIVPGGGTALLYASKFIDDLRGANEDQNVGINIVRKALQAPIRQIVENAGMDGVLVAGRLLEGDGDFDYGFDAQLLKYCNLVSAGIIDPVKVVRVALQDAASVAGLLITTEVIISNLEEDKK